MHSSYWLGVYTVRWNSFFYVHSGPYEICGAMQLSLVTTYHPPLVDELVLFHIDFCWEGSLTVLQTQNVLCVKTLNAHHQKHQQ